MNEQEVWDIILESLGRPKKKVSVDFYPIPVFEKDLFWFLEKIKGKEVCDVWITDEKVYLCRNGSDGMEEKIQAIREGLERHNFEAEVVNSFPRKVDDKKYSEDYLYEITDEEDKLWECQYCKAMNSSSEVKCENCGAPRRKGV